MEVKLKETNKKNPADTEQAGKVCEHLQSLACEAAMHIIHINSRNLDSVPTLYTTYISKLRKPNPYCNFHFF